MAIGNTVIVYDSDRMGTSQLCSEYKSLVRDLRKTPVCWRQWMLSTRRPCMDADKLQKIQAHAREIAALLYDETAPEQLTTLAGIEEAIREHVLEYVSPEIGHFLSPKQATPAVGDLDT